MQVAPRCFADFAGFAGRPFGRSTKKWGAYLYVKKNAVELAREEVAKMPGARHRATMLLSSVTDPYQGHEAKYRLVGQGCPGERERRADRRTPPPVRSAGVTVHSQGREEIFGSARRLRRSRGVRQGRRSEYARGQAAVRSPTRSRSRACSAASGSPPRAIQSTVSFIAPESSRARGSTG